MPAAPEFLGILSLERRAEIVLEPIAHQPRQTDRDVGVSREIAVKLQGEGYTANRDLEAGVQGGIVKNTVYQVAAEVVGYDDLLDQARHYEKKPLGSHIGRGDGICLDLRQEVAGTHHGPREQRSKKRETEGVVEQIALGLHISAVNIHYITDGAECDKRYAGRHEQVESIEMCGGEVVPQAAEKIEVFEETQQPQVGNHDVCHNRLAPYPGTRISEHAPGDIVVETDAEQYQAALGAGFVIKVQREEDGEYHLGRSVAPEQLVAGHEADEKQQEQARIEQQRRRRVVAQQIGQAAEIEHIECISHGRSVERVSV